MIFPYFFKDGWYLESINITSKEFWERWTLRVYVGINPLLPPPIRAAPDFIHHWFGCSAGGRAFWPLCCGYTDAFLGMCIKLFWIMNMNLHAHVYFKHILEWRFISSDFCWFVHRSGGHGTNLLVDEQKAGDALVLPRKNHQQLSLGTQIGSGSTVWPLGTRDFGQCLEVNQPGCSITLW